MWVVAELTPDYPSQHAAICVVAKKLCTGTAETLRKWVRRPMSMRTSSRRDIGQTCRD
jgi:hypothetical protein